MARIRTPKSVDVLANEVNPVDLFQIVNKYKITDEQGRYLHWDQFKWRVEKDDDPEAAWLATKIARKAAAKKLVILQAEGEECFSYCVPDSLYAMLHHVDRVTGGGHELGDGVFISNKEKDRHLVQNLMMEEAITSSQLEGASTTRKVAKEMLESDRKPKDKSEQMIYNNYLLMKKAVENKNEPLSIELILELHQIVTHNAIENDAVPGELRKDNDINIRNLYNEVAFEPPCYTSLPDRLHTLCQFANEVTGDFTPGTDNANDFIHPIVKAVILHFMVAYIHPFADGNGRTARAIFYWYMLRAGYWLFEYVSISKLIQEKRSDYDTAFIYTETDDFDLSYFIYNQVETICKSVDALQKHIENKKSEFYQFMQWVEKSPLAKGLKLGQKEILKDAIKQPGLKFTAKQVARAQEITENTARTYLNELEQAGLLMASKVKNVRGVVYIAPADIQENLKL